MLLLYMSHLVVLGLKRVKNGFFGQIFSTSDDKNVEKHPEVLVDWRDSKFFFRLNGNDHSNTSML